MTTLRSRLMSRAAIALLAASFAVGIASAAPVAAARVTPGVDSMTVACMALQRQEDGLIDDWSRTYSANASDARLDTILAQIREIGMTWRQSGCQDAFGSIESRPLPVQLPVAVRNGINMDDVTRARIDS